MYLRQPGFTYIASTPFNKGKNKFIDLKKEEIQDIFNGDFKNLPRRLDSEAVWDNKSSDIAKNLKYGGY